LGSGFLLGYVCGDNPHMDGDTVTDELIAPHLLFPTVSLAVAVILFEGGLTLRISALGDAESGVYSEGEDTNPQKIWGRDRFMPTNFAFLPDGDFLLADGYGSYYIHRYDRDGRWKSCWGGPGDGEGTFDTPHGLWIDDRGAGEPPQVVVADRAHHTLQWLTVDGQHRQTVSGFGLPANLDRRGDRLVVPELFGCVTILGPDNRVLARLGDDADRIRGDEQFEIRSDPERWNPGRFVHPHDACFDHQGNLFVAEWVATGRVSKLLRRF